MAKILDIDELDRESTIEQSKGVVEAERQCRIVLNAGKPVELGWNVGGKHGRNTVIVLSSERPVVQPLSKAQAWFGPFAVPLEFASTTDERRKQALREFWAMEKARYLNRYDYPRPLSAAKGGIEPIGPHRSPDVSITIIEADGTEHEPIRLHELYKIGDWDPLKDTFGNQETAEEVKARYEAELSSVSEKYEHEITELRRQMSEVAGMVKGMVAVGGGGK